MHGDDGLPEFEIGHDRREVRAANQGEEPLLIVAQPRNARLQIVHDVDVGHDRMMRHPFQRFVAEVARLATADHRRVDLQMRKAAQPHHGGGDGGHVGDLVFGQVPRLGAGIGRQLLALAVVKFLRDRERLVRAPAPPLAAGLLQRRQIEQARRRLPAMLDRDGHGTGVFGSGLDDGVGHGAVANACFDRWRVAHYEGAALDLGCRHDLEIVVHLEVENFQFAQTHDGQRWRFDTADADDAFGAAREQRPRSGACQRQVEDLIGLLPRHRRLVERLQFTIGLQLCECLPQ